METSEFERFIDSQVAQLIAQERTKNSELGKEQELGIAIDFCKRFLLEECNEMNGGNGKSKVDSKDEQRRRDVLAKLVELKLELEQYREEIELREGAESASNRIKGHEFVLQSSSGRNPYCETCLGTIWRFAQKWRRCTTCGFRTHEKCMGNVKRPCPSLKTSKIDFQLYFQLCPEQSLRDQNYQCAECSAPLCYDDDPEKLPRLCDYTGFLYCRRCHWNDEMVIPARLVRNWDFEKRPVCRATKQLLNSIAFRPLINLQQENPLMFKFVHTLNKMQNLRTTITLMKCYFISCKFAKKLRILQHLSRHQHFVESDSLYTFENLVQLANGRLLQETEEIVKIFTAHITEECEICRGNAFYCEICSSDERIYPFSENVAICKGCLDIYHRPCFEQVSKRCMRCARRRARRRAVLQEEEEEERKAVDGGASKED